MKVTEKKVASATGKNTTGTSIDEQVKAFREKLEADAKAQQEKAMDKGDGSFWDTVTQIGSYTHTSGKSAMRICLTSKEDEKSGVTTMYVDIRKYVHKKGDAEGSFNQHTVNGISIPLTSPKDLQNVISDLQRAGAKAFKYQQEKKIVGGAV